MKKVLAILLATFMVVGLCAFAFADGSVTEQVVYHVEFNDYATGSKVTTNYEVNAGESVTLTTTPGSLEFLGFEVTGSYELVSQSKAAISKDSTTITIKPNEDLVVNANYKGTTPVEEETTPGGSGNESDQTGVSPWFAVGMIALAVGAVGVILTTKRLVGKNG